MASTSSSLLLAQIAMLLLLGAVAEAAAPPAAWSAMPLWVRPSERQLLELTIQDTPVDAIVAKDASGNYSTVAAAVAAARRRRPRNGKGNGKYVIYIKRGIYFENVDILKAGIMLIGDGIGKTVISGNRSNKTKFCTPCSATLFVNGNRFMARDLSIENTAGKEGKQAVALRSNSTNSVFYRCGISGFQDTLLAENGRQFYRECEISGTVDFVFGNAKAVYQSCHLLLRRPVDGTHNVITAQGRNGPDHASGFSFQNFTVKAYEDLAGVETYLGRPWRNHSHVVFMECFLDDIVHPHGWVHWTKGQVVEATTRTIYYGEYSNTGPGANLSQRVKWPGFHVMDAAAAARYTVQQFIRGNDWLPATGVEYRPGL